MELSNTKVALFSLGDASYLLNYSTQDVELESVENGLLTVLILPKEDEFQITESWVKTALGSYQQDDVFRHEFLHGILFCSSIKGTISLTSDAHVYLRKLGNKWYRIFQGYGSLLPGPYVLSEGHIRNVWRLYKDDHGTATATFLSGSFEPFPLSAAVDSYQHFAVPSRMKNDLQVGSKIAGWRVLVKDNLDIAGVHTTLCNRAFRNTFLPASKTAVCLQKLVNSGAIIIGKAKLNSFGVWEEPAEYIDYQAPWNPRADGFQSPGGSSTGSAAAVAAYDWLDIAIGTDTNGSIMRPALWCGCFGLRPTFGAISSIGLHTSIDYLDTPAILSRDLQKCRIFASEWYGDSLPRTLDSKPFTSILWSSDHWKTIGNDQFELAKAFVKDLETQLGLSHINVSLEREWQTYTPEQAKASSLQDYMVPASINIGYDFYHKFDEFRDKHKKVFKRSPFVGPAVRRSWDAVKTLTVDERDEAVHRFGVFRKWFNNKFMSNNNNPLIILPVENLTPRYRDEPPNFIYPPKGVNSLLLSPILGAPELVVPVGEISYMSRVSEKEEHLPFAIGLVSRPGSDMFLMDVTYDILKRSGRSTSVRTGERM